MKTHESIPKDFPVRPVRRDGPGIATCGYCLLRWDDTKITDWTPTPSARCPFEYFHVYPDDCPGRP
jgi:hypothetical protein